MERAYDAIVLAGGAARRLGGTDKPMVEIAGRTLLDRVLDACADAGHTVVVGPARPVCRAVVWAVEEPPGGGPAAALQAGLQLCSSPWLGVFAADLPFLDAETVGELRAAAVGRAGAVLLDGSGRTQWLAAVYLRTALLSAFARFDEHAAGLPVRKLVDGLDLAHVPARALVAADCDTWEDVAAARQAAAAARRGE